MNTATPLRARGRSVIGAARACADPRSRCRTSGAGPDARCPMSCSALARDMQAMRLNRGHMQQPGAIPHGAGPDWAGEFMDAGPTQFDQAFAEQQQQQMGGAMGGAWKDSAPMDQMGAYWLGAAPMLLFFIEEIVILGVIWKFSVEGLQSCGPRPLTHRWTQWVRTGWVGVHVLAHTLTWILPPYVLYGVKYIGLVSLARHPPRNVCSSSSCSHPPLAASRRLAACLSDSEQQRPHPRIRCAVVILLLAPFRAHVCCAAVSSSL